jgi:hypothetical protein
LTQQIWGACTLLVPLDSTLAMFGGSLQVKRLFPELEGQFLAAVHASQRAAEQALVYAGAQGLVRDDLIGIEDPRTREHFNSLLDHFNVLFPELQKYTYVNIDPATVNHP